MKKILALLLCAILVLSIGTTAFAERKNQHKRVDTSYRKVLDEGYIHEGDGFTLIVRWCQDGDAKIFGRMYVPTDFDENATYTTIVMCHGHMGNSDFWDNYIGPALAKQGYVCYAIDCRSANDGNRDYSTPNEDHTATVSTYASDVVATVNFVRSLNYVDKDNLYLMGQSMGSMAVQTAGSRISDQIAGLILFYGFVSESSEMMESFGEAATAPYANGEVLMLGGTLDAACSLDKIEYNMSLYEKSTMVLISGAKHGYGREGDRPTLISVEAIEDFLQRTHKTAE